MMTIWNLMSKKRDCSTIPFYFCIILIIFHHSDLTISTKSCNFDCICARALGNANQKLFSDE